MTIFATIFISLLGVYLLIGLLFSIPFYLQGMKKVDAETQQSGMVFKLIIFPGILAFWPVLLNKWRKASNQSS